MGNKIMRLKDRQGVWHDVPAIVGRPGKGIVSVVKTGTSGNVDTYTITFTDSTTTTFTITNGEDGDVTTEQMNTAIAAAIANKADKNGYYTDMTVGNSEQLIATVGITDTAPYLFRTSGGSADIGNRVREDWIEGGTVVRNQLAQASMSGWTLLAANGTFANDEFAITATTGTTTGKMLYKVIDNTHVWLASAKCKSDGQTRVAVGFYTINNSTINSMPYTTETTYQTGYLIVKDATLSKFGLRLNNNTASGGTGYFKNVVLIDLTQMFGSSIADYLATLPIDDALNLIKPWIDTNKYYAFNTGSFESVNLLKKVSVGFNQWDEEWEVYGSTEIKSANLIPVLPNVAYNIHCSIAMNYRMDAYDANGNYLRYLFWGGSKLKNKTFTVPQDVYYLKFTTNGSYGTTYNHDICINLSHNGSRNGEYKAYETHEYAMPSGELRGMPTLDANNNIVYNGDRYYPDDVTEKRYGIVEFDGSADENWRIYGGTRFFISLSDFTSPSSTVMANIKCDRLATLSNNMMGAVSNAISAGDTNDHNILIMINSETDTVDKLRTWLNSNPIKVIYLLTTPTTSEGTPYQQTQIVDDWGTEQFVTAEGNEMPVGHSSFYQANLRDKLQHLPSPANADGTYAIQQVGSQMHLIPIPNAIPTPPESGTYTYKSVNGTPAWVEEA